MGSDRARVSYDETRRYRAVVAQQGRVTLEADLNEATAIDGEAAREQTLEIVGPTGTPDDGYRVLPPATPQPGTTDLYRCFNQTSGDHFYTTSAAERDNAVATAGYVFETTACYVFGGQPGPTDFYRCFNQTNRDHFYTTSLAERDNAVATAGYVAEGIACYLFATPQPGTTDLYRCFNQTNGDHFYTTSLAERDNAVATAGYTSEGTAGYVFATPPFDFQVGAGTMYVGGVRSFLPQPVTYSAQDEWLDAFGDPDWLSPAAPAGPNNRRELIYLSLAEREVSATEDRALLEVALGGPDSSQRLRLAQRVKRLGTDAETCEQAMADAEAAWAAQGLHLDPATMRLESAARLQVSFTSTGTPPDPCEPDAQGGYLGADNQLIRVQVTAWDPGSGTGRLVWGFDAASFLYRVDVVDPANRNLVQLQSRPPDDLHQPRVGQAVELLRSAVKLDDSGEFVASAAGEVLTLTSAYVPDTRRIALPSALPAEYADPAQTPMVFLRVWEQELDFTPGTPLALDPPERPTGIQVTLTAGGGPFPPGDFWLIGVRPAAPTQVYPPRYLGAPQPADGPRLWACPLAVVDWTDGVMHVVEDCRDPFDNLVDLTRRRQGGGCCDVTATPADAPRLQELIDKAARAGARTVCLRPGTYLLHEPLRLDRRHAGMTLTGCPEALLTAEPAATLAHGLVFLGDTTDITLRGLRLRPVAVGIRPGEGLPAIDWVARIFNAFGGNVTVAVALRALQTTGVTLDGCVFELDAAEEDPGGLTLTVGVLTQGICRDWSVRRCRFLGRPHPPSADRLGSSTTGWLATTSYDPQPPQGEGGVVAATVDGLAVCECTFTSLDLAVGVMASCGRLRFQDNLVESGVAGFAVLPPQWLGTLPLGLLGNQAPADLPQPFQLVSMLASRYPSGGTLVAAALGRALVPPPWTDVARIPVGDPDDVENARKAVSAAMRSRLQQIAGTGVGWLPQHVQPLPGPQGGPLLLASQLHRELSHLEIPAYSPSSAPVPRATVQVLGNDVRTRQERRGGSTGLVIGWPLSAAGDDEFTMVANHFFQESQDEPAALAVGTRKCAVTGNHVRTEAPDESQAISLLLLTGIRVGEFTGLEEIAVTGNVFHAPAYLPPRLSVQAPLDQWAVLNAIIS